jgi:hypothetical protein
MFLAVEGGGHPANEERESHEKKDDRDRRQFLVHYELFCGDAIARSEESFKTEETPSTDERSDYKCSERYLKHALRYYKRFERNWKRGDRRKKNACQGMLLDQLPDSAWRVPLGLPIVSLASLAREEVDPDAPQQ